MAGTIKTNAVQLGDSATDSQNFLLKTNVDGTATLARGAAGSLGNVLTVDASGVVTATSGLVTNRLVLGTAVATTSGTSIDFTGIPSWVKRITVMLSGVSTTGTSNFLVQLGAGSITSSGYAGGASGASTGGNATASSTAGFPIIYNAIAYLVSGQMSICLCTGTTWVSSHTLGNITGAVVAYHGGGNVALAGVLDRIRLTTVGGTDTFDAGSVNILYEG